MEMARVKKSETFTKTCKKCGIPAIKNSIECTSCGAELKTSNGMGTVEPIRNKKDIEAMKVYLKSKSLRDWVLFVLGINSALRISDLLKLNISDVVDENGEIRERILVKEIKTSKSKNFPFNNNVVNALTEYISTLPSGQIPLFASRKGEESITRQQTHRILSETAKKCGIKESISNHSLRKSFAYALYEAGVDITRIQSLLNHSSPKETLRYIGINQLENDRIFMDLNL